jgi:hypothetical protein
MGSLDVGSGLNSGNVREMDNETVATECLTLISEALDEGIAGQAIAAHADWTVANDLTDRSDSTNVALQTRIFAAQLTVAGFVQRTIGTGEALWVAGNMRISVVIWLARTRANAIAFSANGARTTRVALAWGFGWQVRHYRWDLGGKI